jgi:hypothetical protein
MEGKSGRLLLPLLLLLIFADRLIFFMQKGHYYRQGNDDTNYGFPILKHD